MTVLAGGLIGQNLIAKEADPRDGRLVRVHITQAGRRILEQSRTRRNAFLAKRLRGLSGDELHVLEEASRILLRLVEEGS